MKSTGIMYYIRQCQLKRILYPLFCLLIVIIIMVNQPLFSYFQIRNIDSATPLSSAINEGDKYVKTVAKDLYYTGEDYYYNGVLTGHYYYQLSGNYCRVYIITPVAGKPADTYIAQTTVTGAVVQYNASTDELFQKLAEKLNWSVEGLNSVCDPYVINEVVYFPMSQKILFFIVVVCFIAGLLGFLHMLVLLIFPKLSSTYTRLYKYGNPDRIIKSVENELENSVILQRDNMTLTSKYLIEFSSDLSAIVPLSSVLWIYKHGTLRFSFRYMKKKMSYTLRIVTITGDNYAFKGKRKQDIEVIQQVLEERYPNFFFGYSDEHDEMVAHILKENKEELKQLRKQKPQEKRQPKGIGNSPDNHQGNQLK